MIYKYNIILLNVIENTVEILHTCSEFKQALEHSQTYLTKTFELGPYLKANYDNQSSISIYKYHYLSSKELIYKIVIVKYCDTLTWQNCKTCIFVEDKDDYEN